MNKTPLHNYQVLTKRSGRLKELSKNLNWGKNIWMGVSVECQSAGSFGDYTFRIDDLRNIGAQVKFLSIEPLIGPVRKLKLKNIHWVIVGGESGPKARPMKPEWVITIRDECKKAKVSFFFKQWGGVNKKKNGRVLKGRTWEELPTTMDVVLSRNFLKKDSCYGT